MKLSIIIPVYRVEATLDRCLMSVVGQPSTNLEVILVDDGSPDRCPEMCDDWARRDSRIRVIHQPNGGLSAARNTGIRAAQGEFITFVDSDDFLELGTYSQVLPLTEGADIVEFPVYRHFGSARQTVICPVTGTYDSMEDYWLKGRAYEHCYAWNKIYRRELFRDVEFPNGRVFEDVYTLPLLLRNANRVTTTDRGLYYYCVNADGITATAGGKELSMLLEAHLEAMQQWCDDQYYLHILNIQTDVCEATGRTPKLPLRRVNPFAKGLTLQQRLKAITLDLLGVKATCQLNKTLHRWKKTNRS